MVRIIVRDRLNDDTSGVTTGVAVSVRSGQVTLGVHLIEQTDGTVIKECAHEIEHFLIRVTFFDALIDPSHLRVVTEVIVLGGVAGERNLRIGRTLRQCFRLQTTEGLSNHRFGLLGIEITNDDQRHVVRHIPRVVELDQFGQTRVLEVLGQTDHVTLVRRSFVDILVELFLHLGRGVVGVHIVLLEHVLQLGLEGTEHRVNETIGEDSQPTIHLSSREGVVVCREIIGGEGVDTLCSDEVEQHKEIFQRRDLRLAHGGLVDLCR